MIVSDKFKQRVSDKFKQRVSDRFKQRCARLGLDVEWDRFEDDEDVMGHVSDLVETLTHIEGVYGCRSAAYLSALAAANEGWSAEQIMPPAVDDTAL